MNRLDWLKAIRRGLSANAVIAIGAFTTYLFSEGVVSAAAIAVLLLDAMSAAVFLLSSYLGKTAAEMALVMTVLSVIVLSTAGAYLVSYLFSNLPESIPSAVETEADPPAYFEESESPIDTMNGNQSPSPDDLPLVIAENDEEDGDQDESPVKEEIQDESEPSSAETEAEDSVPAPEEIIIEQEPIIEEPDAEETDTEPVAETVIDEPVSAEEPSEPVVTEEPAEEAPVSTVSEAVIEEEPEAVIVEPVSAEVPEEERSEPVVTEEPVEETPISTVSEEAIEEDEITSETSEFAADDFFAGLSEDEAAFWADFYIAGEEDLELADGTYYMDLYVNDSYMDSIDVLMENGNGSVSAQELYNILNGFLTEEASKRIFVTTTGYFTIEYLNSVCNSATLDTSSYRIDLKISGSDMPLQVISLKGGGIKRRYRPLDGALTLEPAVFTIASRYQLTARLRSLTSFSPNLLEFQFSSSNSARLYDVHLDFNYYMDFGPEYFRFRFGNYNFYTDFEDESIRLQWGNVSTDLLSPAGTSVGIKFDKALSYGNSTNRSASHIDRIIVIEKESDVIVYNDNNQIFRRTLQPGQYRMEDFTLYTGANRIKIVIDPLDGSEDTEIIFDVNYSYSLLAPGEMYYGAALTTGRKEVTSASSLLNGSLHIPIGESRWLEYDARNIALSGYLNAGLTSTATLNTTLAFSNIPEKEALFNPSAALALQLTHANVLGTTRYNLNVTERSIGVNGWRIPNIYARVGHQITTNWKYLSSFNIAGTYNGTSLTDKYNNDIQLSVGLSGTIGFVGYSLNANGGFDLPYADPYYSVGLSIYMNFTGNFSMNSSLTVYGDESSPADFSWSVYGTYRFGSGSVTAKASDSSYSIDASASVGDHEFTISSITPNITDFNDYAFEAGYAYSGDYFGAGIDIGATDTFKSTGLSVRLSTTALFADGLFTLSGSMPSNFVLINQQGALKGNAMTIGSVGNSSSREIPQVFGTSLYTGIPYSGGTSFSVFSSSESSFGNTASFDFNIPESNRGGYVIRLTAESKYSATAEVVLPDGMPWINAASPIYRMEIDDDGNVQLQNLDEYLFTDSEGRFVLSNLEVGDYAFDIYYEDTWILGFFSVQEDEDHSIDVQLFEEADYIGDISIPDVYSSYIYFEFKGTLTGDEFWNLLYPAVEEAV